MAKMREPLNPTIRPEIVGAIISGGDSAAINKAIVFNSALLAGYRNNNGNFNNLGNNTNFWSSTEYDATNANNINLNNNDSNVNFNNNNKAYGFSARCAKDSKIAAVQHYADRFTL